MNNQNCKYPKEIYPEKSIFKYITNPNMFINKNKCFDPTPPFIGYDKLLNVDIESNLFGLNRFNSKCSKCKYNPQTDNPPVNKIKECKSNYKILPFGYGVLPKTNFN